VTRMNIQIGAKRWQSIIQEGAAQLGVMVDDSAMRGFETHATEMIKFNRKINLTAITDPYGIAVKHIVDSLAAAPHLPDQVRLLDIGSGAGFPGIPLKLVRPASAVTLIDGSVRKVSFLKHIIRQLNLEGICACHLRAEQMAPSRNTGFNVVVSRALADLERCIQLAYPLVDKEKGIIIALRGHVAETEVTALRQLLKGRDSGHGAVENGFSLKIERFSLPFSGDQRTLVIVRCKG